MAVRPVSTVRRLVIIEEGLIFSMAATARFVKEFPFLRQAQALIDTKNAAKPGCSGCHGNPLLHRDEIMLKLKMTLAGMPDDRRRLLASMLNAKKLRITYRQGTRPSTIDFP